MRELLTHSPEDSRGSASRCVLGVFEQEARWVRGRDGERALRWGRDSHSACGEMHRRDPSSGLPFTGSWAKINWMQVGE